MRRFRDDAASLVVEHGGSISGEHRDGQSKAELLPKKFGPELIEAFREFKSIWDPDCPAPCSHPFQFPEH